MILKIYTVHDRAAEAFLPPFFLHSDGLAERAFAQAIANPEHQFGQNPEDYTLFQVGQFDDETGVIETNAARSLGNGVIYAKRNRDVQQSLSDEAPVQPGPEGLDPPLELRQEPRA